MLFNNVKNILKDISHGNIVIVTDDVNRENEGDFVIAAEKITPNIINFFITYGKGLVCVPLPEDRCNHLRLPLMVSPPSSQNKDKGAAFTVSVDLKSDEITTGISTFDRAKTILALVNKKNTYKSFNRPGHIFPLISKKGGVLSRPGHTEAAVDLTEMAGCIPGAVIIEILKSDGTMARNIDLIKISKKFGIKIASIQDIINFKIKNFK